ncbi:MAG: AMP-binding protein [Nocardioides sp.]|jgi:acyl-CoA synthetase (AMP-forming)/AMP-acid ligase II
MTEPDTIPGVLRAAAARWPDRPAYVEAGVTTTFAGLLDRVRAVATRYVALGLAPGDRVVLWAPNSVDWVVAALAVSYAGGTLIPANSRYTGHEVAALVDRTSARLVIVEDGFLGRTQTADLRAASSLESVIEVLELRNLQDGFEAPLRGSSTTESSAAPVVEESPEGSSRNHTESSPTPPVVEESPEGSSRNHTESSPTPPVVEESPEGSSRNHTESSPTPPVVEESPEGSSRNHTESSPTPPVVEESPEGSSRNHTESSAAPVVEESGFETPLRGSSTTDIDARADAVSPEDVADILFTSGTTGQPKGVMSAHRQTVGVARAWGTIGGVREDDRYLVVNPFFHSFGYKVGIVTGLLTGACLYPMATFDPATLMALIQDEQITVLPGAPTIFSSMLAAPERQSYDLSSLRLAVTGAAVVPVVLIERMRDELAIEQVVTAFGMTEAVVVTMCRGDETAAVVASTCGRAIDGMETSIADDGELLVRGDFVMLGYLDDPEATAEAIDADGWLHTGDIGTVDADGNLAITDRKKDMYISGGFNVYPAEIEKELARLDGVVEAAIVGVPDERLGEVGAAFVVRTREDLTPDDVITFCKERLANFKVPRTVTFVDALPRNLGGKVLKNALRQEPTKGN